MSWKKAAENNRADQIPAGVHRIRFIRILRGSKDGGNFETKNGDPQIMLISADNVAREAAVMITLSEKAMWKLATYLQAIGANLDAMDKDGITPAHFADPAFATKQLCDRWFEGEVKWKDGYADIIPLKNQKPAEQEIPI